MSNFVLASILMETKMRQIDIKEVGNKHEMDEFVEFGNRLYADCPYYVPDLKSTYIISSLRNLILDWSSATSNRLSPVMKWQGGGKGGCDNQP